jgi:two-component system chemotaxis response regulator CheY
MSAGRILLVDDDAAVRKSVRLTLTKAGYEVVDAEDGVQGVQAIRAGDNPLMVDTIICDLNMPKMDGREAIRFFRSQFPSVPVIVLTGYPESLHAEWLQEHTVTAVLTKPAQADDLIDAVDTAAQEHELFKDQFVV